MAEKKRASSLKGYGEGEEAELGRKSAREALRALVGMQPYDETNPTEVYRILSTPTPLAAVGMIGRKGLSGIFDAARSSNAFKGRGLEVAQAEQFSVKELMDRLKEQGIDVERTWLRGKKDTEQGFRYSPKYDYLEALYQEQKRPDAVEIALREAKEGRPWSYTGTLSRQPGDRNVTKENTRGGVWLTDNPMIGYSYSGDKGSIIPVLTRKPDVVLDAKGEQWNDYFGASKEFKEAQRDPGVKSIEVRNIIDYGGRKELPQGLSDDEIRELLTANNLFLKKPFVDQDVVSKLTGEPFPYQDGGEVSTEEFIKKNVPRGTSEVPQLDPEGRLIDEREDIRSESQRMLNRLQSQPSKVPPGIRRAVAASKAQGKESMFPAAAPARDLLSGILGASPTAPGSEAYRTGQAIANMPPVQAAAAIPAKVAASAGDAATALVAMGPAMGAVMKPKGGNWLAPSVERGLNYLIPRTGAANRTAKETLEEMNRTYPAEELARMPETRAVVDRAYRWLEPNVAVQNWIEKKLTKYVKNEMATPEDPVRALAERGILHVDPEQLSSYPGAGNPANQAVSRRALGYPEEGLARSEAAKKWEAASDYMIQTDRAQDLLDPRNYGQGFVDQTLAANPWLTKVDPYERIYGVDTLNYRPDYSELGFDHLIDELKNSLNPNSGLPRALQLTPKQLDKVSMPQAVELVDKINKWRIENAGKLQLEETLKADLYKAYPEQDYRWVQLNRPGQFAAESDAMGHSVRGYEPPDKGGSDYYGLGGFEAIQSGEAKVYSLRDEKGQPHVTIEVEANPQPYPVSGEAFAMLDPQTKAQYRQHVMEWRRRNPEIEELTDDDVAQALREAGVPPMGDRITQIKGKGNGAPAEKYLPFIQDFVKSGNWSEVDDLQNTGLIVVKREQNLPGSTIKINPGYYTLDELRQLAVDNNMSQDMLNEWMRRLNAQFRSGAYKDGGEVIVPRETSTSKKQLDTLAQISQRKKA